MPTSHDEIKKLADAASVDAASLDLEALSLMDADDVKTAIDKAKAIDVSDVDPAKLEATKADATKKLGAGDLVGAADGYLATLAMCKSPALLQQYGPALYSNLALVHHKSGDAAASLAAADESIKLKPEWHKAHFRRGEALFELRRHADALASYQEASRLSPADADVKRMVKLTEAAAKGGLLLLQLSPGRDIAIAPTTPMDQLIFGAAASMKNFIYLIADATSRECFCVDPCWDPKGIATYAEKQKLKLVGAIGTHYHFDHVGGQVPAQMAAMVVGPMAGSNGAYLPGLAEMKKDFGCKLYCHASERERVAKQISLATDDLCGLEQGTSLKLGSGSSIEVYHTPGHSAGSICLGVLSAGASKPTALIVGDTIFPGSCGRLDLPDSDINAMFDSLQKLRALDDAIKVYPGHGYSGDSTTIGREKQNGLLRPFSRDQWRSMHG